MSANTKIEWATHTFNPWEGCTKVGPGCDHCYAENRNARFAGGTSVNWGAGSPRRRTSKSNWQKPITWNSNHEAFFKEHGHRQRVFCASLADIFDNKADPAWREELWVLIRETPHLDWLLLTKRVGNVPAMLPTDWGTGYPNVWLGISVINQEEADRDIEKLLAVPTAKRFLSMEPLLGHVDISRYLDPTGVHCIDVCPDARYVKDGEIETYKDGNETVPLCPHCGESATWTGYDDGIDWVIVGGESGPNARPMHPDWACSLRDQCEAASVPFMFKQWGEHDLSYDRDRDDPDYRICDKMAKLPGRWINLAGGHGFNGERVHYAKRVGKKAAGRLLDGRTWDGYPS